MGLEGQRQVGSLEDERAFRLQAERTAGRLARLQRITSRLLTASTSQEVARVLTDSVVADGDSAGATWCQVWLVEGPNLVLVSASGAAPEAVVGELDIAEGPGLAACVRARKAAFAVCSPTGEGCPEDGGAPPPLVSAGLLPIVLGGVALGGLVVAYPPEDEIDTEERGFLAAMADQAAQALERARLSAEQATMARTNGFLAESAQILAEAPSFTDALERLARLALTVLGDICLIDVGRDDGRIERMVALHREPFMQPLVDKFRTLYPPDPDRGHPVANVIRSGEASWAPAMSDEFLRGIATTPEHFKLVKDLGFHSYITVPLVSVSGVLGSLTLVSADRTFEPADVAFAKRLAHQVGAVVFNAHRYDATLQTAHILQQSLLPKALVSPPGLQIDTRYLPATRGLEVGGDFYDMIMLPSHRVGFMIGDVAGHNRDAAAAMGQLRSAARVLSGQVHSPASLIETLQWSWDLLEVDRMTTAVFGRLDQTTGDMVMASAGHPPPLLITPGAAVASYLPVVPCTPLGAPPTAAINWEGRLERGQTLLLYTDGTLDDRDHDTDGALERLAAVAADGDPHPAAVCGRIVDSLPVRRADDVALLALRIWD